MSNAKIIVLGEVDEGTAYVPVALNFLKMVRNTGVASINKSFPVGDGTIIRVVLDPHAGDKIYIELPKCPAIKFSGLLDTFKAVKHADPGKTPKYLLDRQIVAEVRDKQPPAAKLLSGVVPIDPAAVATLVTGMTGQNPPDNAQGADGDFYTQYTPGQPAATSKVFVKFEGVWAEIVRVEGSSYVTTKLPVEPTVVQTLDEFGASLDTPVATVEESKFRKAFQELLPTRFTGIMRKVVQATFATDAWEGFVETVVDGIPKAPKCPVNYKFGDSWGCIKSKGKYFFIQIVLNTVYYVPSKHCVHKRKPATGAPYDVVVLKYLDVKNKVSLGTICPQGSSWDPEIGWAFSYDKPEAAIVLAGSQQVGQDTYVTTSLATISIGFGPNETSVVPTHVDIKQTKPAIMWRRAYMNKPFIEGGHAYFNAVSRRYDGETVNVTVDFGMQREGQPSPPSYRADRIPVYVFYTEKGMQLCTYTLITSEATSSTIPTPNTRNFRVYNPSAGTWSNVAQDSTALVNQRTSGSTIKGGATTFGFACGNSHIVQGKGSENSSIRDIVVGDVISFSGFSATFMHVYSNYWVRQWDTLATPPAWGPKTQLQGYAAALPEYGHVKVYVNDEQTIIGGGVTVESAMTLSTTDREVVLILTTTAEDAKTTTHTNYLGTAQTAKTGMYPFAATSPSVGGGSSESTAYSYFVGQASLYYGCGESSLWQVGFDGWDEIIQHVLFDADTGEALDSVIRLTGGDSAGSYSTFTYNFTPSVMCAGKVLENTTYNIGYTFSNSGVGVSGVESIPAKTTNTLIAYGHGAPVHIPMGYAQELTYPEPASGFPLAWVYTQAAHTPDNVVTHKGGVWGNLVAKLGANTYSVIRQLHGWLGEA